MAFRRSQGYGIPINLEDLKQNANSALLNNSSELGALSPVGLIDRSNEMSFRDVELLERSSLNLTKRAGGGHMSRGSVRDAVNTNRSSCSLMTVASIRTNANNANSRKPGTSGSTFRNHL